jgi:hypothetical protein
MLIFKGGHRKPVELLLAEVGSQSFGAEKRHRMARDYNFFRHTETKKIAFADALSRNVRALSTHRFIGLNSEHLAREQVRRL